MGLNDYFLTYLTSDLTADKSIFVIQPELFKIAKTAAYYIYKGHLDITEDNFIDLLKINDMWLLSADELLLNYFETDFKKLFDRSLDIVDTLLTYLPDHHDTIKDYFNDYIIIRPDGLTPEIASMSTDSDSLLNPNTILISMIKNKRFADIERYIRDDQRDKLYSMLVRYSQMPCITMDDIHNVRRGDRCLVVLNINPVIIGHISYCGKVSGCSRVHKAIFIVCKEAINKSDLIYIQDQRPRKTYRIRSIFLDDQEVQEVKKVEPMYSIGLLDFHMLPKNKTDVYVIKQYK